MLQLLAKGYPEGQSREDKTRLTRKSLVSRHHSYGCGKKISNYNKLCWLCFTPMVSIGVGIGTSELQSSISFMIAM